MKIVLLTVGTRGDVQPFVALGQALHRRGHAVTIATHDSFARLVTLHGLGHASLNDDLIALTNGEFGREMMDGGTGIIRDLQRAAAAKGKFVAIYERLLQEEWEAAQGAELLIYHPQAIGGAHIAEALGIPGIRADLLPTWVPTSAFPHLMFPELPLGGAYNRMTFALAPVLLGAMFGKIVRRWRKHTLGLERDSSRRDEQPVPTLLGYSPLVIPRPADWTDQIAVTGYWFLARQPGWQPSPALQAFLVDGPAPVYVGFGSMAGRDPNATLKTIVEALKRSGQRGLLARGWGGIGAADDAPGIFQIAEAPHDWLFRRMAAVVHHGGAGTTAEALRAGKPNVICPFAADQPLWGRRIERLGVGPAPIPQRELTPERLGAAIRQAVEDPEMRKRAAALGERIRAEDGLEAAVAFIERQARELDRAGVPGSDREPRK